MTDTAVVQYFKEIFVKQGLFHLERQVQPLEENGT